MTTKLHAWRTWLVFAMIGLLVLHTSSVALAAGTTKTIRVLINGTVQQYDQPPVMINGITMVPLRGIFEKLGASLEVQGKRITATRGETVVVLVIGESTATINGKTQQLAQPSVSINGRTLVPLRFVSQALGANVEWDAAQYAVVVTDQALLAKELSPKLGTAIAAGDAAAIEALLKAGADPNADNGQAFVRAVHLRDADMVRTFLEAGADVDTRNLYDKRPVVFIPAGEDPNYSEEDNLKVLSVLLEYKPDLTLVGSDGNSVIMNPISFGRVRTVEMLLQAGADPNWGNTKQNYSPPLFNAIFSLMNKDYRSLPMVKLLLDHGADPRSTYQHPQGYSISALSHACTLTWINGVDTPVEVDIDIVKLLIERGADPKTDDSLFQAVNGKNIALAKLLLEAGADPNQKDRAGQSMIDVAKIKQSKEMEQLLRQYGAK